MAKRDVVANMDVDAPRAKRRKDAHAETPTKEEEEDVEMGDAGASSDREDGDDERDEERVEVEMSVEEVAEKGLQVWHAVKNAVSKDGRSLSFDFQRLPSKRQYGDYYKQITRPISLEEIKNKLDRQDYSSLEEVRDDIELMCKNARTYNMRESQIWRDAKSLQKTANKEIDKLLGVGEGESDGEGGKKKKEKKPNLPRLLKNRLNKLIEVKDENGYSRTEVFMDLVSKKQWPDYYKIITRPICFNDIHKRIKRKEYSTIQDFMNDVDLVFDNAMTFNADDSTIYMDAVYLKSYFHNMMSDLPKHFAETFPNVEASAAAPAPHRNKITLKLPGLHQSSTASGGHATQSNGASGSATTVRLRVPALNGGAGAEKLPTANGAAGSSSSAVNVSPSSSHSGSKLVAPETLKSPKAKVRSPAVAHATIPKATSTAGVAHQGTAASTTAPAAPLANSNVSNTPATPAMARTIHQALPAPVPQGKHASHYQAYQGASTPVGPQYSQYTTGGAFRAQHFYQTPQSSRTGAQKAIAPTPITPGPSRSAALPPPATTPIAQAATPSLPGPSASQPPVPRVLADPGMHSARVVTQPLGRPLVLDVAEGVRSWSVRLGAGETRIVVRDVRFAGREREREGLEGSEAEGATADEMDVDIEEGEGAGLGESVAVTAPKRKRGRGRPRKNPVAATPKKDAKTNGKQKSSPSSAEKSSPLSASKRVRTDASFVVPSVEEVLVKFGGLQISPKEDPDANSKEGEWEIEVGVGRHVLEIGKKGNSACWKVFVERRTP
ncbi:Bromodomain-containing protein [Schizopora paradoxa]|uniref:Bromodomain-containing protein n=1 Tax=Schizopora paradoxa TaxID=27342 RepID=A0A0H2R6X3_9AGAM|nr:Bromodomain-containing protein [Schizopora paradoxa]